MKSDLTKNAHNIYNLSMKSNDTKLLLNSNIPIVFGNILIDRR